MNLLSNETSPYLRQHKDNPVHWMPWGDEAFAKAKKEGKPVLLSIGYAACHWCHVMAHESFEDGETADLMNTLFVNVKVDREERPDVDMIYQNALSLLGQQGGWPLTMFLTPGGEPFWGGTYFPPHPRHGLPGFREVLRGVNAGFQEEGDKIAHNVKNITQALEKLQSHQQGHIVTREIMDRICARFLSMTDTVNGGLGSAPKFPNLTIVSLLWDAWLRTEADPYKASVLNALTQMCQGGICDHIGGGFCRYAVDAEWLVPHFEKMLYDNALFLSLLSEVYRETRHPLFAMRIRETVDWLLREMRVTDKEGRTAFASSLDADSMTDAGVAQEGAYYVWRAPEVDELLGDEAEAFKTAYDITGFGNWEGMNIPNRLKNPGLMDEATEQKFSALRKKLLDARQRRPAPGRDDKVLADWNGLAISGLCKAGFALDAPEYIAAAQSAFDYVVAHMSGPNKRLMHSCCEGQPAHAALLEDVTNMAAAALDLHEATGDARYAAHARDWAEILLDDYLDVENKGFFMSPAPGGKKDATLILRPKTADDTATPAGNGTAVSVLTRLFSVLGEPAYLDMAEQTASAFSGDLMQRYFPLSTLLANSFFLTRPLSILLRGSPEAVAPFVEVLRGLSLPHATVTRHDDAGGELPAGFSGKITDVKSVGDEKRAAAYICAGHSCLPPVFDAKAFRKMLMEERRDTRRAAANDG
ncbi:MAG: DUF255 domain-containing protein [Alphaproteobacteria bacterium]|nr:DUF255 domain-containing protein [Alphaproteobacteria bacterium]